jgi:transcriptional regulator with PAS, ATPase and Fis domain
VIEAALRRAGGNRTRAAAALGISRQALLARIRSLGL